MKFQSAAWLVLLLCAGAAAPQSSDPLPAKIDLPPLGWSSWNGFSNTIDSNVAMNQARLLVSSGLHKAGYEYVNLDEGWWLGERDDNGNIVVDPKQWPAIAPGERPGDMGNIVRYIHSLGLKAGIYTDGGRDGCSYSPDLGPAYLKVGSEGHYQQDFLQFAQWGFDYVKVDWCGGFKEDLNAAVQYAEIVRAIDRAERITGDHLYLSICDWGKQSPWSWGPGVGGVAESIWRVSDDIVAPVVANNIHADRKVSFENMLRNFDQGIHPEAQHTGYYNDPDMMVLGMPGLNAEENRLHMSLWVVSAAPLIMGADLSRIDSDTVSILRNADALSIDQDPLGLQCIKIREQSPGIEVWSKFLSDPGARAVLLLNRTKTATSFSLDWVDLGLSAAPVIVRDVWAEKDLGITDLPFQATVAGQDGLLLVVKGKEGSFTRFTPAPGGKGDTAGSTVFEHLSAGSSPFTQIKVVYTNRSSHTQVIALHINEETGTNVAFPPTGSNPEALWIQVKMNRGANNRAVFTALHSSNFAIESIEVHQQQNR